MIFIIIQNEWSIFAYELPQGKENFLVNVAVKHLKKDFNTIATFQGKSIFSVSEHVVNLLLPGVPGGLLFRTPLSPPLWKFQLHLLKILHSYQNFQ